MLDDDCPNFSVTEKGQELIKNLNSTVKDIREHIDQQSVETTPWKESQDFTNNITPDLLPEGQTLVEENKTVGAN